MAEEEEEVPKDDAATLEVAREVDGVISLIGSCDMESLSKRVAAEAVLRSLEDPSKRSSGRAPFMKKVTEIAGKAKGRLGEREIVAVGPLTGHAIVKINAPVKLRLVLELVFDASGILWELGLAKSAPPDFLKAAEKPASAVLEKPFLVPRPDVFPKGTLEVRVAKIDPVFDHKPYLVPRPLLPYVKLHCGDATARTRRLPIKTPDQQWDQVLSLDAIDGVLEVVLMDHNAVGRNAWLANASVPLANLALCTPHDLALPLLVRRTIKAQDLLPLTAKTPKLHLVVTRHDVEAWWALQERAAREARTDHLPPEDGAPRSTTWWALFAGL